MKKFLLGLLVFVLILGGLAAAGYAGYQVGFRRGVVVSAANGTSRVLPADRIPGPRGMPMHNFGFDRGFNRGFAPGGFGMMHRGMGFGFGFFGPLMILVQIAFWALVIWGIYMLVSRSGWRLTRTSQAVQTPPPPAPTAPAETENPEKTE